MNPNQSPRLLRRPATLVCVGLCGLAGLLPAAGKTEPPLENYIVVSAGTTSLDGSRPAFQKATQQDKNGFLGVEDLYLTRSLNDTTTLVLKGHALAGANDYLLDLQITKDEVGYLKMGYQEFRVWYNGLGGFFPPNGLNLSLYNEDLHVDRAHFWFEAGYTPEEKVNLVFRYDLYTRDGKKDSTSWGDTNLTSGAGTRGLSPAFHQLDETRHQASLVASQQRTSDKWELALRADQGDYTNSRNEVRRATEAGQDRKITHKEGRDYDLFQVRGLYVNQINEKLTVTTAVARTRIDSAITGSRIYGMDYDPVYDPAFANRQQRDEGILDLTGHADTTQTVGTLSALYQPTKHWSIVPALRLENIKTNSVAEFIETNFTSSKMPDNTELESSSDRSWKNISESLEARYQGIKNVSLNFKAEWLQATGDLTEEEIDEPGTPAESISIDRDTEFERHSAKYAATASWYPVPGTTIAVQYYNKSRQNDYRAVRDSTTSTADRYPAYVANQDFETNDFNVRLSWRASPTLRTVTRYDYQKSTIGTQDIGLGFGESGSSTSHILSETISFNPLTRWYLQGTMNYVWDQLTTPAVDIGGAALNRVKDSAANYMNFSLSSGYAIDEGSDIYVDYSFYRAFNDFVDNSAYSVAYGTEARMHQAGVTWFRQIDRRTSLTLRYAYAKSVDDAVGNLADYEAHMVYAKMQYRF